MKNYCIAVPTFQRCNELRKLLASIPMHVQVFISDNGSTLPDSVQQQYPNANISRIVQPVPMFSNWNLAANSVKADWVAIPSDDDIYYTESFTIIEKYLRQYADMDMIIFGHNIVDADENVLNSWTPKLETCIAPSGFLKFQYGVDARMPSVFIKTLLFKELGGFDEGFRITASDSDFIQRAVLIGNVQFVPEVISGYRVWDGGLTHKTIASLEWMKEIDRWCNRIMEFCVKRDIDIYTKKIQDEIYARNLLAGIVSAKRSQGYISSWEHMMKCRYPYKALLRTQLRLLFWLIKP